MSKVQVFDPPMCCATGVCGPEVDPALVRFASDLEWLKSSGVEVERFNLAQQPAAFVGQPDRRAGHPRGERRAPAAARRRKDRRAGQLSDSRDPRGARRSRSGEEHLQRGGPGAGRHPHHWGRAFEPLAREGLDIRSAGLVDDGVLSEPTLGEHPGRCGFRQALCARRVRPRPSGREVFGPVGVLPGHALIDVAGRLRRRAVGGARTNATRSAPRGITASCRPTRSVRRRRG